MQLLVLPYECPGLCWLSSFEQILKSFFNYIKDCNCNVEGSTSSICDKDTGACDCKSDLITGTLCDQSVDGYFGFPTPEECHCNEEGSEGGKCW